MNNIKTFMDVKNKGWLSIGKTATACAKMLHNN